MEHPRLGLLVLVSNDKILLFFTNILGGVQHRLIAFPNIEQALEYIAGRDTTVGQTPVFLELDLH